MSDIKVKICGLTRTADVRNAVAAGAALLGFVFAPSPRRVTLDQARELLHSVPSGTTRVGLFMDPPSAEVARAIDQLPIDCLQFHGSETNEFCRSFGLPFVKAIGMQGQADLAAALRAYPDATALLLDSHAPGERGGTGQAFDWDSVARPGCAVWLAGGLTPENVAYAISRIRPDVVDVSSGVETRPGVKDHALMTKFVAAARNA
ncbi:MAG: phosphoribosylanthranilate isomerase [Xanthomonadales bacterium]|nr:phosphoribosylanthranilate isomerase [Xanthomonadales bacterium]